MSTLDQTATIALVTEVVTAFKTDQVSEDHLLNLTPTHWVLIASELADQILKLENQSKAKPQHSLISQIRNAAGEQKTKAAKAR